MTEVQLKISYKSFPPFDERYIRTVWKVLIDPLSLHAKTDVSDAYEMNPAGDGRKCSHASRIRACFYQNGPGVSIIYRKIK